MTAFRRVLLVEDHESFRRAIRSFLQQRPDVRIVGEAGDGLDAVHQAEVLQPDVVVLDIGLPTLNGVQVAGRIRVAAPGARILLVTNESSVDVIQEAFRRGVHGYVYKPRVQKDLFAVFDAIVEGGQVVSGSLERIARGDMLASHRHDVLFWSSDAVWVDALSRFIGEALDKGSAVIVLATEPHDAGVRRALHASCAGFDAAMRQERYILVNISETLSKVMVNGRLDQAGFDSATSELLGEAARRATGRHPRVAACGECAPTLWAQGQLEAAVQLEHLWDELSKRQHIDILCGYPTTARHGAAAAVRNLCAEHTAVEIH